MTSWPCVSPADLALTLGDAPAHQGDQGPGQVRLADLRKPFVGPDIAPGLHHPPEGRLDAPAQRENHGALGALGAGDGLQGQVEEALGPFDEPPAVAGASPDVSELRVGQAKMPQDFAVGMSAGVTMTIMGTH